MEFKSKTFLGSIAKTLSKLTVSSLYLTKVTRPILSSLILIRSIYHALIYCRSAIIREAIHSIL